GLAGKIADEMAQWLLDQASRQDLDIGCVGLPGHEHQRNGRRERGSEAMTHGILLTLPYRGRRAIERQNGVAPAMNIRLAVSAVVAISGPGVPSDTKP